MLIKQISTQTDNHKYSKSVASKKLYTLKFGSEVSKPLIQSFMQYSIFFFKETPTLWSSEVNEAILAQAKVAGQDYGYMLGFFKKFKQCTQI